MSWDLRQKYAFDPTESQIAEGNVSPYGQQNSHANCVPASFTAALLLAGYPDVDPQQIINDEYGPNWRGGTDFGLSIDWIKTHIANPPKYAWTRSFDFDVADAAGSAGNIPIIAGWIDAPSVTFQAEGGPGGFSHASILAAHNADDTFVIWNVWLGTFQTYSRDVIAASLYEMAVMEVSAVMTPQENKALVILAYLTGLGRTPESQAVIDMWAAQIHTDGSNTDQVVSNIVNSPEGLLHRKSTPVAAHEHDFSGRTTN